MEHRDHKVHNNLKHNYDMHSGDTNSSSKVPITGIVPLVFTIVISIASYAIIHFYALSGEDFISYLNHQIGEVVARRAIALEKSGQSNAAISEYRNALQVPFDDTQQRIWTLRRLGKALIEEKRYHDATIPLEECIESNPNDDIALGMLCKAYHQIGENEKLLNIANDWLIILEQMKKEPTYKATALFYIGNAHESMNNSTEALNAYIMGSKHIPTSQNAYHAAVLLKEMGRNDEALSLLNTYMEKRRKFYKEAVALRKILKRRKSDAS